MESPRCFPYRSLSRKCFLVGRAGGRTYGPLIKSELVAMSLPSLALKSLSFYRVAIV